MMKSDDELSENNKNIQKKKNGNGQNLKNMYIF